MSERYHNALKNANIEVWNNGKWFEANLTSGASTKVAAVFAKPWVREAIKNYEDIKKKANLEGLPADHSEDGPQMLVSALEGMRPTNES
jgi:hypothetical protein